MSLEFCSHLIYLSALQIKKTKISSGCCTGSLTWGSARPSEGNGFCIFHRTLDTCSVIVHSCIQMIHLLCCDEDFINRYIFIDSNVVESLEYWRFVFNCNSEFNFVCFCLLCSSAFEEWIMTVVRGKNRLGRDIQKRKPVPNSTSYCGSVNHFNTFPSDGNISLFSPSPLLALLVVPNCWSCFFGETMELYIRCRNIPFVAWLDCAPFHTILNRFWGDRRAEESDFPLLP